MGMSVGGKRGIVSDMNVVPLIDILLVLLVIFMIIPRYSKGLDALVPQPSTEKVLGPPPDVVVIQVLADGTLRTNQEPRRWERLGGRIEDSFELRRTPVALFPPGEPAEV